MQLITDLNEFFSFLSIFSIEGGPSDLNASVKGVAVGSGLVGNWIKNVNSFWVSEEFGVQLNEIKTIWIWFLCFFGWGWICLLDSFIWLKTTFGWWFVCSPERSWVNHFMYIHVDIWSNLFVSNISSISLCKRWYTWWTVVPSIVWICLIISTPVKNFNLVFNEVINIWFNSWLRDILHFFLNKRWLAWWSVIPSIVWVSSLSSGNCWDWAHVFVGSDETVDFLINVFV